MACTARATTLAAGNAKRNYVGSTNYVQKWKINCATFCGVGVGMVTLRFARWLHMKKPPVSRRL